MHLIREKTMADPFGPHYYLSIHRFLITRSVKIIPLKTFISELLLVKMDLNIEDMLSVVKHVVDEAIGGITLNPVTLQLEFIPALIQESHIRDEYEIDENEFARYSDIVQFPLNWESVVLPGITRLKIVKKFYYEEIYRAVNPEYQFVIENLEGINLRQLTEGVFRMKLYKHWSNFEGFDHFEKLPDEDGYVVIRPWFFYD